MLNRLTDTLNFQSEALNLRSERQRVLASNIANADTPGYQARDIDFAQALREATGERSGSGSSMVAGSAAEPVAGATSSTLHLATTASGHLDQSLGTQSLLAGPRALAYASPAQTSLDGNSVDMDRERAAFADNSVKYEATLRFINSGVRTMLDAIKGQ
jgi:flagellar basal-body rod protein FlgB